MKSRALRLTLIILAVSGITLLLRASLPTVATGTWVAAGTMAAARSGACTAVLSDGRQLISGGADANVPTNTADLFSTTGSWSAAAKMSSPRSYQSCAVLPDGRVLVAGGTSSNGVITNAAELYDASADTWTPAPYMNDARSGATASVLQDGRVLIAGGQNSSAALNTLEIFDPNSNTFSNAGTLASPRQDHAAAVLQDGRVLIAGGSSDGANPLNTTEIYDPQAGSVSAGPAMSTARARHTATTLLDGTVVVIGGTDYTNDLASAEVFDPVANNFSAASNLATARSKHSAFLLPNSNEVLVVSGQMAGSDLVSAELYIPWQKVFQATGAMGSARSDATGAALTSVDGRLLIAGGVSASAELYGFATVKTDAADYPPGTTVKITGSGWQPGETVTLTLVESPLIDNHGPYPVVADAFGNISDSSFVTDTHDVNVKFSLTAVGSRSQAQNTFTDATKNYDASITPTSDTAGHAATSYSVTITNDLGSTGQDISTATINIPAGYTSVTLGTITTNPPGLSWTASVSAGVITLTANGGSSNHLAAGQSVTVALAATAPCTDGSSVWTTATSGSFTLQGSQPTVTITGSCTASYFSVIPPASVTAGSPFNFSVTALTTSNAVATNYTGTVHFTSSDSQGVLPANYTFTGADAGTHTFTATLKTAGSQSITATDTSVSSVAGSGSTTVNAAAASKLGFSVQPTNTNSNANVTPDVAVQVQDSAGNPVAQSGRSITLAIGSNPSSGTLVCGTNPVLTNSSGLATFPNCHINNAGTGYTLTATASGTPVLTSATSNQFNINSTITKLAFTTAPLTGTINQCLGPITVQTQNSGGTGTNPSSPVQSDLSISSGGTGAFFLDSTCNTGTTNVSIPTSANSANFFFKGTSTGSPVVQAADHAGALTLATQTETVNQASTTTALASSGNPSVFGQSVTFTATVTVNSPGTGNVPSGETVTFKDGATTLGTGSTNASGIATLSTSVLSVASHSITAVYGGDTNLATSTSSALSQVVNPASTTTALTTSVTPSVFGQSVTFTASVTINSPGTGSVPSGGTVTFKDGATSLGTGTTNASGVATVSTSSLNVSTHSITAAYAGDPNLATSTSAVVAQVVSPASTTTLIAAPTVMYPANATITVTVSSTAGTPSGNVSLTVDGGTALTQSLNNGVAVFTLTSPNGGSHNLSASYAAQGNFAASSTSGSLTVNQATPTVSFTGAPATAYFNSQFTVSASTNATTTATITASGACTIAGTTVTMISGLGTCSLQASWAADTNYVAATATQSTNAQQVLVTVSVPDTTVIYDGTPKSITPTVTPAVAYAVTYTGISPTVYATSSSAPTEPGSYTVAATATDPNYVGSGSGTLTISQKDPVLSLVLLTGMPEPSSYGTRVYFELTTANSPCPTGEVQFFVDSNTTPSSTVALSNSPCTNQPIEFSTATLTPGTHTVTAVYSGDTYYLGKTSAPVSHQVIADTTTVTLATSAMTVFVGDAVTLTATVTPSTSVDGTATTPSGTVQFYDGPTLLTEKPLSSNTATFTISSLSAGSHSMTATFVSANGDFTGNSSPVDVETVDKITPTINWPNPADIVYGTKLSPIQLNATATDTHNSIPITGTFTYNPAADTVLPVGTRNLTLTFTPDDTATYASQSATATINVTAANLTVTADDASRFYGADNPTLTSQYSGFVNGEGSGIVTMAPTCSTTADSKSSVGTYDITCSGAVAPNYTITYVKGKLTVNPALLTITANDQTKAYGTILTLGSAAFTTSGLVNSDMVASVTLSSAGAAATATVGGSPYTITPSAAVGTGLGNYTINYANGKLTVNPALLTITANDQTKAYGTTPTLGSTAFTPSGLLNGDMVASVTLTSTGTAATATVAGSPYAITPSAAVGTGLGNYTISYVNGTLTVNPATLTLSVIGASGIYNALPYPSACSVATGLVNGDSVTLTITYSSGIAPVNVGAYTATCTSSGNSNYQTASGEASIMITAAPLTVTGDNQSMTFGGTTPGFTASYSGFQGSDTSAVVSGLTFTVYTDNTLGTAVTDFQSLKAGSYPIVPSGAMAANYSIQYGNGTLTVNKATLTGSVTVTPADPNTVAYGQPVTATVFLNSYSIGGVPVLQPHQDPNNPNQQLPESLTVYLVPANGGPSQAMKFGTSTAVPTYDNTTNTSGTTKTGWTASVSGKAPTPGNYTAVVYGDDPGDNSLTNLQLADAGYWYPDTSDISYPTLESNKLNVVPAALTITANNANKPYGLTLPFLGTEFTTSGLVNSDTVSGVTLTSAGAAATATVAAPGPTYAIVPSAAAGTGLSNYTISYVNGTLTVTKAHLTVTADNQSRFYGDANSTFTATITGFVNGETLATSGVTGSANCTSVATPTSAVGGPYSINCTVGTLAAGNYDFATFNPGQLTVNKAHLTVTGDNQSRFYGDANPALTATISGFKNGETLATSGVTGSANCTTTATPTSAVPGPYSINCTAGTLAAGNYDFTTFNPGQLTVNKAHLTVTGDNQSRFYGDANPAPTATVSSYKNGETLATSGVTGSANCTTTATPTSAVPGPYSINCTVGTLAAGNYDFTTFNSGQLTINQRLITATADPQTKIYGKSDPALTYKITSGNLVNGDVFTGALNRAIGENVGTYAILQGTLALSGNYKLTYAGANLTITPAPLTITASGATVNYGAAVPAITAGYAGFVNGDAAGNLTTAPSCTTVAHGGSAAGSYATNCSGAVDGNYMISYMPGTVTIQAVALTITASSTTVNYGAAVSAITASYNGFVNSDTSASLTTAPTCTTAAHGSPSGSPIGGYTTNCSGAVDSNYVISYMPGTVTIQAVPLTITASSAMVNYGAAVPATTASYSGLVNGDTPASLTAAPACTTSAHGPPSGSPVGSYGTTCSGALDNNYIISYAPGTVTVQAVPLTITASSGSMIYGGPVLPVTAAYSGFVNSDTAASLTTQPTCWTPATSLSPLSGNPYASTCSGAADSNYTISYMPGIVTVIQATTTTGVTSSLSSSTYMQLVTFTATVTPQYAGTTPTGTVTFQDTYNGTTITLGTFTLTTLSGGVATLSISSLQDTFPNSITAVYGGDSNFVTSTSPAITQTVQPAPNVSLSPMSVSFGNQNVNTTSAPGKVILTNIGDATLNISSNGFLITGTDYTEFAQTNNCGSTVAAGKSCTINISFTPTYTGVASASLQITDNDDDSTNAQQTVSLTGAGLSTISGGSLYTDALFATANGCGSILAGGGSIVDSFSSVQGYGSSHVLSGGNVGTNGNVTLNGSKSMIYGSAAVDTMLTGNCSKTSVTGITTSGGAQVTGGAVALNGPINYPAPPAPSPAPPTTTQNISGSCGSISGCTNTGTKTVSLAPGQYGNLSISGGTTAHVSTGTYNINSLTLSGNSILYVDSGPVVVNLAGASLSGANPAMDASGGSIQNPSGKPSNLQFTYAGSRGLTLSGGSNSYAVVYAPNALVNISGGSDFFGSIIGSTVTATGGTATHFDTSLADIQPENYILFTAVVNNVNNLGSGQVKLYLTNSSIQFTGGGTVYTVPVPNAVVTFNAASQSSGAKTTYDLTNSRWSTAVAKTGLTGNTFVAGVAFKVPTDFPTGIQNATWSASFSTDTQGVNLQWQWGAAVYGSAMSAACTSTDVSHACSTSTYATTSPSNTNVLGINAEDGSANANGTDPAGTPEAYKASVIFGATGGGLTNYTGYRSSAAAVVPTIAPMSVSPSSLDFGTQNQGTTTATPLTAVLTNNDSNTHNFSGSGIQMMGTNAADFTLVPNGPGTLNNCLATSSLASGASCTLYATFTPGDVGTRTAKIVLNDDANNSPQTVYLSGTGQ